MADIYNTPLWELGQAGGYVSPEANRLSHVTLDSYTSLDALGFGFQMPEAATLTGMGIRFDTKSGTVVQHRASLQGVTGGLPDASILGSGSAYANFTPTAQADDSWLWLTFNAAYELSVTKGQFIYLVVEPTTDPAGSSITVTRGITGFSERRVWPITATKTDGGAWTKSASYKPIFGVRSATKVYGYPVLGLYTTTIGTNGYRQAAKLVIPAGCGATFKLSGVSFAGGCATGDFKVGVWTSAATLIETTMSHEATIADWPARNEIYFDDDVELTCGTTYYVGIERVANACTLSGYTVNSDSPSNLTAFPGGSAFCLATYDGSWTEDATVRPMIAPILSDLTEPTVSGGGSLFGDRTGGKF